MSSPRRTLTPKLVEQTALRIEMQETNGVLGEQGTPCCGAAVTIGYDYAIRCRRCGDPIRPAGQ